MAEKLPRFGATDFYLLETDAGAIKEEIRAALAEFLGYTPTDADVYMNTALALMPYLVQTRALADAAAKSTLLSYAIGQNLDRVADATCVAGYLDRLPAQRAFALVRLNFTDVLPTPSETSPDSFEFEWRGSFEYEGTAYEGSGSGVITKEFRGAYVYNILVYVYLFAKDGGIVEDLSRVPEDVLLPIIQSGMNVTLDGSSVDIATLDVKLSANWVGADAESDESFAKRIEDRSCALRLPGGVAYYSDMLNGVYGLRDYYVSPYAYAAREGHEEDDAGFVGCVQITYLGELDSIPAPDDPRPVRDRVADIIAKNKLISDRVMLTPAKEKYAPFGVYYSVLSGTGPEVIERIRSTYYNLLDKYCRRLGVVVDFDDITSSIVQAGAFDARVRRSGTYDPPNLALYANEYLEPLGVQLIREEDVDPKTGLNPELSPTESGSEIIE